jgi:hypothetical protein
LLRGPFCRSHRDAGKPLQQRDRSEPVIAVPVRDVNLAQFASRGRDPVADCGRCAFVIGGSTSTASCSPMMRVDVMGDHIRVLPSGSGSRPDCGIWLVTNTSCCSDEVTSSPQRQIPWLSRPVSHSYLIYLCRTTISCPLCGRFVTTTPAGVQDSSSKATMRSAAARVAGNKPSGTRAPA